MVSALCVNEGVVGLETNISKDRYKKKRIQTWCDDTFTTFDKPHK